MIANGHGVVLVAAAVKGGDSKSSAEAAAIEELMVRTATPLHPEHHGCHRNRKVITEHNRRFAGQSL
jgi:hypothetical protein